MSVSERKSLGADTLHPGMPREVADVLGRRLSIFFERSCLLGAVSEDWKRAHAPRVF